MGCLLISIGLKLSIVVAVEMLQIILYVTPYRCYFLKLPFINTFINKELVEF